MTRRLVARVKDIMLIIKGARECETTDELSSVVSIYVAITQHTTQTVISTIIVGLKA